MDPRVESLIASGLLRRTAYRRVAEGSTDTRRRVASPPITVDGPVVDYLRGVWPGVTRSEWRARLACSPDTLYRWLHASEIPDALRARVEAWHGSCPA